MKFFKAGLIIIILIVLSIPAEFIYSRFCLDQFEMKDDGKILIIDNNTYTRDDSPSFSDEKGLGRTLGIAIEGKRTMTDYIWPFWVMEYKDDKEHNRVFIRGLMGSGGVYVKTAYKEINKTLGGFIYSSEGKLVKEAPVKISGKQCSETSSYRDYFDGKVEIDGEVIDIRSTNNKAAVISDFDTQNYYLALNPAPDKTDGVVEHTTSVTISKDFSTTYGYTPNLRKSYGQGAFFKSDKNLKTPQDENIRYLNEADKRVKLYVAVMKAAFQTENGGNGFIAVKEGSLEGLKEEKSKQDVLESLKSLSQNVYWYEGVKDDKSLFEFDKNGMMTRTLNGTLLSIKVEEFSDDEAVIEATSWVGNLGAVFPKYKAVYRDGQWQLKVVSMAVS